VKQALPDASLDQLFREARTYNGWTDRAVDDELLSRLHELVKLAGVDREFFSGTNIKSNFICSLGYGDPASLFPRNPRLSLEEAGWFA
jgi:hypothetical protein